MTPEYLQLLRTSLSASSIELAPGLGEEQLAAIEEQFGFRFPADLRTLLAAFVPAGEGFPDWHRPQTQAMLEWLAEPAEGLAFDVEENEIWPPAWGERPDEPDEAIEEAYRLVALAPILIPLQGDRYLPSRPTEGGNPVFAVDQSEVELVAPDLGWFLHDELGASAPAWERPRPRAIELWSELAAGAAAP
ncbi:MAG: uncharacterized protein JWN02_1851 [Acidobacteria bacterium]|nr:uncharacterized protein [Acidobacteriota bacterium]